MMSTVIRTNSSTVYYDVPAAKNVTFFTNKKHPLSPSLRRSLTTDVFINHCHWDQCMDLYEAKPATLEELQMAHKLDYIIFLRDYDDKVRLRSRSVSKSLISEYVFQSDTQECPVGPAIYNYARQYYGATVDAACRLGRGDSQVCINLFGGMHHAARSYAKGYCHFNDCVGGIKILER